MRISFKFQLKEHLDYLLNETNFTADDLLYFPYIFARSVDEIKARIKEMTRIGAPITLPMIYQGKTRYLKFIRQYCTTKLEDKPGDLAYATIEDRVKRQKTPKNKAK